METNVNRIGERRNVLWLLSYCIAWPIGTECGVHTAAYCSASTNQSKPSAVVAASSRSTQSRSCESEMEAGTGPSRVAIFTRLSMAGQNALCSLVPTRAIQQAKPSQVQSEAAERGSRMGRAPQDRHRR